MNARMPELRRAFELAGFSDVRTLLSSGNVVFSDRARSAQLLRQRAERAMQTQLDRTFVTFVRSSEYLQAMLEADPFGEFDLPPGTKCVVAFLRQPCALQLPLPIVLDDARVLKVTGSEVYSTYVPGPNGPTFMRLLERTFGTDITTRTLDTVRKCAWA
jgi:uncharacterized protein (DUF1697 family)